MKEHDESGAVFAAQQLSWLFWSRFLRAREAAVQTLDMLSRNPNPVAAEAYARQARAYLGHDPAERRGGITAPTLVIAGEQDLVTPPWVAREVADAIPGARLEIVAGPGASHVVPLECPDEFNRLVEAFLEGSLPAGSVAAGAPSRHAHA